MKNIKVWLMIFVILLISSIIILFVNNGSKVNTYANKQSQSITSLFATNYKLSNNITYYKDEDKLINLTKDITYLLVGDTKETDLEYKNRHEKFLSYGLYNYYKETNNTLTSKFSRVSGTLVPTMFLEINALDIDYTSMQNIRVLDSSTLVKTSVLLPNAKMKKTVTNQELYDDVITDLVINYYFLKYNKDYYLVYLYAEINNPKDALIETITENNIQKLSNSIDEKKLINVAKNNTVTIESYSNGLANIKTTSGLLIHDGIIVTTYDYLMDAIQNDNYIYVKYLNKQYELDGVLTVNPETNLAVLKLKEKLPSTITLAKVNLNEDVYSYIDNELKNGIVLFDSSYVESTITITELTSGSPLLNSLGEVVGMNTNKYNNRTTSLAINNLYLQEVYNLFHDKDFDSLKYQSFDELKEKYYYYRFGEEKKYNNVPNDIWQKYNKEFNFTNSLPLELIKASYEKNVLSLRFSNNFSDYLGTSDLTKNFKSNLVKKGYQEKLNTDNKAIYLNDNYQVVLLNEFNYLIIVVVNR